MPKGVPPDAVPRDQHVSIVHTKKATFLRFLYGNQFSGTHFEPDRRCIVTTRGKRVGGEEERRRGQGRRRRKGLGAATTNIQ